MSAAGSYAATNTAECLPDINLVDQYGRATSLASLKGRPVLIDFFYATCPNVCPMMTAKFASIANLLGSELGSKVTIVSITLDPENDHPGDLLKYARTHEADHAGWVFLTGKPEQIDAVLKIFHLKRERDKSGMIMHWRWASCSAPTGINSASTMHSRFRPRRSSPTLLTPFSIDIPRSRRQAHWWLSTRLRPLCHSRVSHVARTPIFHHNPYFDVSR